MVCHEDALELDDRTTDLLSNYAESPAILGKFFNATALHAA